MERNRSLDLLKVICAFMVVCIHAPFQGTVGQITTALSRIAVPLFFMITGYYYTGTKERNNQGKQVIKILRLLLWANLVYFAWFFVQCWYEKLPVLSSLLGKFTLRSIGRFLAFNISLFGEHLWYLAAILYVLLMVLLFEKKWSRRKLYPLVPLLLVANLVFGAYAPVIFGQDIHQQYTRNFLLTGLPYFLLGDMFYTYKIKLKTGVSLILSLVSAGVIVLERYLLWRLAPDSFQNHYFATFFCAVFIFLFTMQCNCKSDNRLVRMLSFIGGKLSTNIYILHPVVITAFAALMPYATYLLQPLQVLYHIRPIAIFVGTTVLVWVIHLITAACKKRASLVA